MPGKPGVSKGQKKVDPHRPNRTQLWMRQQQQNCLETIPPGQEYKCDPRYQPPKEPEHMGRFGRYVRTRNGFRWKGT